ncbi:hypothetical protein NC652_028335 [Populus alba x Populus x berolinensis]|nr:hypothetical protein NC652_028335 [Populus alba x Populus x berolinensis]
MGKAAEQGIWGFIFMAYLLDLLHSVHNLGSAMADVVVDAMIAEAVRSERASFSGDLQSISWLSMAVGGIWGTIQLLSCGLVGENSAASKVSHESAIQATPIPVNGNGNILDEDNILLKKSSASATRRKRSQKNSNKRASMRTKSLIPEKGDSLISHQTNGLVFPSTEYCSKPLNSHVLLPDRGLELGCNPFWGLHVFVGWLGLMLGTFTYNRYLKTMKLRKILLWAHVGLSLLTLLDVILVSRLNLAYGVSDKIMVVFGSALFDAVNQFKYLIPVSPSKQRKRRLDFGFQIKNHMQALMRNKENQMRDVHAIPCIIWTVMSPGIEGTLFALFMSINNLGSTLGSFVGAGLASILNLSSGSFDNLGLGIAIQFDTLMYKSPMLIEALVSDNLGIKSLAKLLINGIRKGPHTQLPSLSVIDSNGMLLRKESLEAKSKANDLNHDHYHHNLQKQSSFEQSGKHAAETNRVIVLLNLSLSPHFIQLWWQGSFTAFVRGGKNSEVPLSNMHYMLFTKPPYAKKPDIRWRLYVFKGGEALNGHFCDFLFLKRSSMKDNPIEPQRYYELFEKDTIKFGNSWQATNQNATSICYCVNHD